MKPKNPNQNGKVISNSRRGINRYRKNRRPNKRNWPAEDRTINNTSNFAREVHNTYNYYYGAPQPASPAPPAEPIVEQGAEESGADRKADTAKPLD